MQIERVRWDGQPERITRENFDCLWIAFGSRAEPSPPKGRVLQWVDWKLQGQLSRYLIDRKGGGDGLTFIPTMKKISTPYLALQRCGAFDWETFRKSCEGLKIRRVLYFCEDDSMMAEVEKTFRAHEASESPQSVSLGSEA